jgi:phage shock protein A
MTGIFSKARTIFLSNIHSVLDVAIDMNSIGAVEQNIRDLENARKDLQGELAEQNFLLNKKKSDLTSHQTRLDELMSSIKTLGATNPSSKALAVEAVNLKASIADETATIASMQSTVDSLTTGTNKVLQREIEMKTQLGRLKAMDATSKAQQRATSAMEAVSSASEAGGSIDSIQSKIERESARSDAAFASAVADLPGGSKNADAEADALLASMAN